MIEEERNKMRKKLKKVGYFFWLSLLLIQFGLPMTSVYGTEEVTNGSVTEISTTESDENKNEGVQTESSSMDNAEHEISSVSFEESLSSEEIQTDTFYSEEESINEQPELSPPSVENEEVVPYNTGPNLLQNPRFTYNTINGGRITNWEMIGTTTPVNVLTRNITLNGLSGNWLRTSDSRFFLGSSNLNQGNFWVSNQNNTGTMIIAQTISTVAGRTYQMSANFRSLEGIVPFTMTAYNGNSVVSGNVGSLNTSTFSQNPNNAWNNRTMQFTATGAQTTIAYRIAGGAMPQGGITSPNVAAINRNLTLQASPTAGGTPRANATSITPGSSTTITANPNAGYRFVRWESVSGEGTISSTTAQSTTFTMGNSNATVRAVYEQIPRSLTLEASPAEGGTPAAEITSLIEGQTTTLTANPNDGYQFVRWELVSGVGAQIEELTESETTFTMGEADTLVRAIYEENQSGEVHVYHVDLDGKELAESEVLEGTIGEAYQTAPQEIEHYQIADKPENATGVFGEDLIVVTYIYESTSVSPVDPTDPETEVDPENKPDVPENQGLLSLDFASQFNFGTQVISAKDEVYFAKAQRLLNDDGTVNESEERPNYVQVTDRRSEAQRNGWQLAVTQNKQFETSAGHELAGARIRLANQQLATAQGGNEPEFQQVNPLVLVPGQRRMLLMAQGDEGTGTWVYRFGDQTTAAESIALEVPRAANPEATTYKTTFTWELSAIPDN